MKSKEHKDHIRYWQKRLDSCEDYPFLRSLRDSWTLLRDEYEVIQESDAVDTAATIFDTFSYFVEMGFYPPPEVLLALNEQYQTYLHARGKLTLEEACFGPAKKKIGNHSARLHNESDDFPFALELLAIRSKKRSRIEIAEEYLRKRGVDTDADSFLRNWRRRSARSRGQ
jgi:hypothetical protein